MYKVSKFNYISHLDDGTLRLYNSYVGSKSLVEVTSQKSQKVMGWFNNMDKGGDSEESDFKLLVDKGYFVLKGTNEDIKCNLLLNDVINSPDLFLTILPTEECNFRCGYCYENHCGKTMSNDVQKRIEKFVSKNISKYTSLKVGWFGGEPLEAYEVINNLSKAFIKICKLAKKTYQASMTTNGYNLDVEMVRKLMQLNNYRYQITIDGLEDTHDTLRPFYDGSNTFNRIINNLKAIRDDKSLKYVNITIRTNFTKQIVDTLEEYIKYFENEFACDDRFTFSAHIASDWGGNIGNDVADNFLEFSDYKKLIAQIADKRCVMNFDSHLMDLEPFAFKCYAARRNSYVIGPNAEIYKCTVSFESENNKIGYLDEQGNMQLDMDKLAQWIVPDNQKQNKMCQICPYSACCLQGPCPNVKFDSHNSFCPRTKGAICEILKLFDSNIFTHI